MRVCTPTEFLAADFPTRRKLVLAQIDAEPELWEQRAWSIETTCGTAHCFGGWAVVLAGWSHPPLTIVPNEATLLLGFDPVIDGYIYAPNNDRQALDEFVELANEADEDDVDEHARMIYERAVFRWAESQRVHRWPPWR